MVAQGLSVQHPSPLADDCQLQGDCSAHVMGGNLSPNSCRLTPTGCSHSQTDWWVFENNCRLIYKRKQVAINLHESVSGTYLQPVPLIWGTLLNWLKSGAILVMFLIYKHGYRALMSFFPVKNWHPAACMSVFMEEFLNFSFKSMWFWLDSECK